EAEPLFERLGLRRGAGKVAALGLGLGAAVLMPEAVAAARAREPAEVDLGGDADLVEEAEGAVDDLGEGTERAARLAAAVEDDAAFEAHAALELGEDARLADAARALDEDQARALAALRVAVELGELG